MKLNYLKVKNDMKLIAKFKVAFMTILPIVIYMVPVSQIEENPIPCLFRALFHINCLGCGMSRACFNAIHFNFQRAIEYNHLVVIVLPLCIFCYVYYYIKTIRYILKTN